MGKISQKGRQAVAMACCIIAIVLNISLTAFGTQYSKTYCDYREEITRGPRGSLLIPLGFSVADTFCAQFGPEPHPNAHKMVMAFGTTSGVFARQFVNPRLGLAGGVVAPLLLVLFAAYVGVPSQRPLMRVAAIASFLLGFAFSLLFFFFLWSDPILFARPIRWINVREALLSLVALAPAMLFIAGGTFLWRKSTHTKP